MKTIMFLLLVTLTGCVTAPPVAAPPPQIIDTACAWDRLILVPKADAAKISDDLAGQILAHDREWKKQCTK